jgi:hypothetical protein
MGADATQRPVHLTVPSLPPACILLTREIGLTMAGFRCRSSDGTASGVYHAWLEEGVCYMASSPRTGGGGCLCVLWAVIIILIPIVGDIACTVYILGDDLSTVEKVLWILAVWLLPWVGRLLYLLVGQKRNRLLGG